MARTIKNRAAKTEILNGSLELEEDVSSQGELSFEEALAELEAAVRALENSELTLEELLAKFAQGVVLSKLCLEKLNSAQAQVDKILTVNKGELILKDFNFQDNS